MGRPDYIPQADEKFLEWGTVLIRNLGTSLERFGFPEERYKVLVKLLDVFTRKMKRATSPGTRTSVAIHNKDEAREILKKEIRQAVKEYLAHNHRLSRPDRIELGLPVYDEKPSPAPAIHSYPMVSVDIHQTQRHTLKVHDSETKRMRRPTYASGFEIWRKVGGTAPVADSEWELVELALHSPHVLDYPMRERGQWVYYRFRWVNTRGEKGPWSADRTAIIS
jgi:hypothetical protein